MSTTKINRVDFGILLAKFKNSDVWPKFTALQKKAAEAVFRGQNLLLTGPAGTGKSFLIKHIFDFFYKEGVFFAKTAMTGVAALNIGGTTLHSWSGVMLAEELAEELARVVKRNKKAVKRIRDTQILFVDEISMASAELLDKLDFIFKLVRRSSLPFGGLQIIFIGDFLQLPPVFTSWNRATEKKFAFEAKSWKNANIMTICLTEIMRQHNDTEFADMLCRLRVGDVSKLHLLKTRENALFPNDGIKPVRIFCKNINVHQFNQIELDKIKSPQKTYIAEEDGEEHHLKFLDKNCQASKEIVLKVGAQVMLLYNHDSDAGLVNGSIGIVQQLLDGQVTVKFTNGIIDVITPHKWELKEEHVGIDNKIKLRTIAYRKQIPLKLAWATTVHKQQGSTIDRAEVDVEEAFECGQVYVALSRVRSLNSLSVRPFDDSVVTVNQKCLDFYNKENIEL